MPKPPSSSSGRGRPPRSGAGGGKRPRGAPGRAPGDRPSEGPPWKRRAEAARSRPTTTPRARRPAGAAWPARAPAACRDDGPGDASKAFRAAAPRRGATPWEPEEWIDEGVVRGEASKARRPRAAPRRGRAGAVDERARRATRRCGGPSAAKAADRLEDAAQGGEPRPSGGSASRRPAASCARWPRRRPTAESVRELLGLTYYRLGRWKLAVTELEAFRDAHRQHRAAPGARRLLPGPRAPRQGRRAVGGAAGRVAERRARGRGPHRRTPGRWPTRASSSDAIAVLERGRSRPTSGPQEHHLRVTYALADLHERAGDVPRARAALRASSPPPTPSSATSTPRLRALRLSAARLSHPVA